MPENNPLAAVLARARGQAPAILLFSMLANVVLLVSALYMLQLYDRVLSSGSLGTLFWLTAGAIAAMFCYGLLEHARRQVLGRVGCWLEAELGPPVLRASIASRLAGTRVEASLKDVADLRGFVAGEGILAFLDAPWTPVFIALLFVVHPGFGVFAAIGGGLLFAAALANDVATRKRQEASTAASRKAQAEAQLFIDGADTIGPLGMAGTLVERWSARQREVGLEQQRLGEVTARFSNMSRALRLILQILILGLGAYYVLAGHITSGGMVAASIVLGRALAPVERSIPAWRGLVSAMAGRRNMERLFAEPAQPTVSISLPRPTGRLSVQNVHVHAPRTRDPILSSISFELDPGTACAVVGPSGSGKSTLCSLVVGARRPVHGKVRLDGADVSSWPAEDLGRHIGYLPQQVELFPGTVAENIARMGTPDNDAVLAAAQLAGVHDMVLRLPGGYETDVGTHGASISLGQRQRIGLARALYGDPAFVVLDEPNANLDSEGDQALLRALARLKERGRTIIIVTHQAAPLQVCDKVLMLRDGKVAMFEDRKEAIRALVGGRQAAVAQAQVAAPEARTALAAGG